MPGERSGEGSDFNALGRLPSGGRPLGVKFTCHCQVHLSVGKLQREFGLIAGFIPYSNSSLAQLQWSGQPRRWPRINSVEVERAVGLRDECDPGHATPQDRSKLNQGTAFAGHPALHWFFAQAKPSIS